MEDYDVLINRMSTKDYVIIKVKIQKGHKR